MPHLFIHNTFWCNDVSGNNTKLQNIDKSVVLGIFAEAIVLFAGFPKETERKLL